MKSQHHHETSRLISRKRDPLAPIQAALDKSLDSADQKKLRALAERLGKRWAGFRVNEVAFRQSRDKLAQTLCELRALVVKDRLFSQILKAYDIPRGTVGSRRALAKEIQHPNDGAQPSKRARRPPRRPQARSCRDEEKAQICDPPNPGANRKSAAHRPHSGGRGCVKYNRKETMSKNEIVPSGTNETRLVTVVREKWEQYKTHEKRFSKDFALALIDLHKTEAKHGSGHIPGASESARYSQEHRVPANGNPRLEVQ